MSEPVKLPQMPEPALPEFNGEVFRTAPYFTAEQMASFATAAVLADRQGSDGPLANTPKNRLIRSAIAQIEAQDLGKWSDDHDRVTLAALRDYLNVWGDREGTTSEN